MGFVLQRERFAQVTPSVTRLCTSQLKTLTVSELVVTCVRWQNSQTSVREILEWSGMIRRDDKSVI